MRLKWVNRYHEEVEGEANSGEPASQDGQTSLLEGGQEAQTLGEGEYWLAEGIKGSGEAPEFYDSKRFKTVADQAKSYRELEKKFGSFTGAPKDGYQAPEGIEADDELFTQLKEFGAATNMSQDGFNKAWELLTAQSQAAEAASIESELAQLGDNAQARIRNVQTYLQNKLNAGDYEEFKGYVTSASAVKMIEKLINVTAPAKLPVDGGENPKGITQEMIEKEMYKTDDKGRLLRSYDQNHERKVQQMLREFYGDGEHHVVVG